MTNDGSSTTRLFPQDVYDTSKLGFPQAVAKKTQTLIVTAGIVGWDVECIARREMQAQFHQAMENLKNTLKAADASLSDLLHLRIYVVNLKGDDRLLINSVIEDFFPDQTERPGTSLLGISALARSELLVEVEGTAAI